MDSFRKMKESFLSNFKEAPPMKFERKFGQMASRLRRLAVLDAFVDTGRKKGVIDFNLLLEENVFLSVRQSVHEQSDEVMYAIGIKDKTLSIGIMRLGEVVERVLNVIQEIKEVDSQKGQK